jgi:hypothetical protein
MTVARQRVIADPARDRDTPLPEQAMINLTMITGIMPMSGRPFLWTRQKAGRLSG